MTPSTRPGRLLVVSKPEGADDVVMWLDDGPVASREQLSALRVFLGEWKRRARTFVHEAVRTSLDADAVLLEVPAEEPDEAGRLLRVAIWIPWSTPIDVGVETAVDFAKSGGRTIGADPAVAAYRQAEAQRFTPVRRERPNLDVEPLVSYGNWLRRLWRSLLRRLRSNQQEWS